MAVDINIKYPNHPRYQYNQVEVTSDLDILIQNIELILFTNKGEVLGEEDFGASLDEFLFKLNVDMDRLVNLVRESIYREIDNARSYNIQVSGDLFARAHETIGILTIDIVEPNNTNNQAKIEALINDSR